MTTAPIDSSAHRARAWLKTYAVPLWLERGFEPRRGYFHEGLNADLTPVDGPVRTMVQARQIFSFRLALDLDLCAEDVAARAITAATRFVLDDCVNPDGSYAHAVKPGVGIARSSPELYTQAFVLLGLANAYALAPLPEYRARALALASYLEKNRRGDHGGFTELDAAGRPIFRSNPLMHLFEAVIAWAEIDVAEKTWSRLAQDLGRLARTKLLDDKTGVIAEEFDERWTPSREDGRFFWEPGHQYEWAWLLDRHDQSADARLYERATRHGLSQGRAIDQVWSDFSPRVASARFWPQAERVKAAVKRGDAGAATEALGALTLYLDHPRPGLWCDVIDAAGQRRPGPSKASSFYHIIGAMAEYLAFAANAEVARERGR